MESFRHGRGGHGGLPVCSPIESDSFRGPSRVRPSAVCVDHWWPFLFNTDARTERHFQNVVYSMVGSTGYGVEEAIAAINLCWHGQTLTAADSVARRCPSWLGGQIVKRTQCMLTSSASGTTPYPATLRSVAICIACAEWKPHFADTCRACGYEPSTSEMRVSELLSGHSISLSPDPVSATRQLFAARESYLNFLCTSR